MQCPSLVKAIGAALAATFLAAALSGVAVAASASGSPKASAAHTVSANDNAHLHLVNSSGSQILEEGNAEGSLAGTTKAYFDVSATVTASFTIQLSHGGSIKGHGSGTLKNAY